MTAVPAATLSPVPQDAAAAARATPPARVVEVDGVAVHIEGAQTPDAETIVLIHGWPDTYRLWDATVAALAPRRRCVRFTLPGFDLARGRRPMSLDAMVAFFAKVVDTVSPTRPVTLVLHDWGAVFGYQYALRHRDRVARVVGLDVGDATSPALAASLTLPQKAMIAGYQIPLMLAWRLGGRLGDALTRRVARRVNVPTDPAQMGSAMNYPYDMRWSGSHGGFAGAQPVEPVWPMLFVWGQRKPMMFHSPAWAAAVAARPGSRVVGMQAGHWLMLQKPAEFHALLIEWLDGRAA